MIGLKRCMLSMLSVAIAALAGSAGLAVAQEYPSKTITMIVPYPPGGSTDILGRLHAQRLTEMLGKQVIIENRGGAGGLIGIRAVLQAPADGHTLLYTTSIFAVTPLIEPKAGYKLEDFVTLGAGGYFPYVLQASDKVPARNLKELVDYAKANPGKLNYVSLGNGSPTTLFMARFMHEAGIDAVAINYQGAGPGNRDLAAGIVQLNFTGATRANMSLPNTVPLGITDEARLAIAPQVGTFKEAGYPGVVGGTWFGTFANAKIPAIALQRLRAAMAQASIDLKDKLAAGGTFTFNGTPEQFAEYIKKDTALWEVDIKRIMAAGIK